MKKLIQYVLIQYILIAYALLPENPKNIIIHFSIYWLITISSIAGFSSFIENRQIQTQIQISQINKKIQDIQKVMVANQVREMAIKKVSKIISRYNYSLDERGIREFANEVFQMTLKYDNLDIEFICATITHESYWNFKAVSIAGARGLMQIMPATGKNLAKDEGIEWTNADDILFNPITNIRLGSRYLSWFMFKYTSMGYSRGVAMVATLASYNGGMRRTNLWLNNNRNYSFLYKETQKYIPRIIDLYDSYKLVSMETRDSKGI